MFEGTGLTEIDLDQDPQSALKNRMGNFDQAYLQKAYALKHGKDDKTVTITSRSSLIGKKMKAWTKTLPTPGLNIAPV